MDLAFLEPADNNLTPCEAYAALFKLREVDAKRWAFAAYVVGLTAALALVVAIVFAVLGKNGVAIASGVGTIVTGVATSWLWNRRTQTQREAEKFLEKVNQYCPAQAKATLGIG